jgi:hypothetical protein
VQGDGEDYWQGGDCQRLDNVVHKGGILLYGRDRPAKVD